jgi:hypothetical protein
MKLSVAYFTFASMWHFVLGQEQSTFLRGSDSEVALAEADECASFGDILNSHEQQPQSLFEDDKEGVITKIVRGVTVDPREYKVRTAILKPTIVNHLFFISTNFVITCTTNWYFLILPCSSLSGC